MSDKHPEILIQFIATILSGMLFIGFIVVIFLLRKKNKLVQEREIESLRSSYENELLQTKLEIQEDTLQHLSMEIHDNIGQMMLLANVNVSILQAMPHPPEMGLIIAETKQHLTKAIDDVSQLSRSLHSDRIFTLGVFEAIAYELELLAKKDLFCARVENGLPANTAPLPKETQLLLFRMYQEVCKNIIRHAQATAVRVSVQPAAGGIQMEISDNGKGFEIINNTMQVPANGVGMRSLESRARHLPGSVTINSTPGEGTTVRIFVQLT